jgi:hypothetical protein
MHLTILKNVHKQPNKHINVDFSSLFTSSKEERGASPDSSYTCSAPLLLLVAAKAPEKTWQHYCISTTRRHNAPAPNKPSTSTSHRPSTKQDPAIQHQHQPSFPSTSTAYSTTPHRRPSTRSVPPSFSQLLDTAPAPNKLHPSIRTGTSTKTTPRHRPSTTQALSTTSSTKQAQHHSPGKPSPTAASLATVPVKGNSFYLTHDSTDMSHYT